MLLNSLLIRNGLQPAIKKLCLSSYGQYKSRCYETLSSAAFLIAPRGYKHWGIKQSSTSASIWSHKGVQWFCYNSKPHSAGPHQPGLHLHFKYLDRAAAGTTRRRSPGSEWCLVLIFPSWSSHLPSCCQHLGSWCSNPGTRVWSSLQCSPSHSRTRRSERDRTAVRVTALTHCCVWRNTSHLMQLQIKQQYAD